MRLANGRDLHHLRDPAHVRERGAHVIDIVRFHQLVEIPAMAPLLARRDGHFGLPPQQRQILQERFRAHRILHEIRRQMLNQAASANGLDQIEALVEIHAPVAVLAHAFARGRAVFQQLVQPLMRVERPVGRGVGGAHAERPVARFHGGLRPFPDAHAGRDPGNAPGRVVAFAVVAHHAAQQLVHRQLLHLALQIPQRQIQRAQGVHLFAPRRIEEGPRHVLPQLFDILRILADQPPRQRFQHVLGAAFADARKAGVGLHRHHHVALIEQHVGVRRGVRPHARHLHLGHGGLHQREASQPGAPRHPQRLQKRSSIRI